MNIVDKQEELVAKLTDVNVYTDTIVPVKQFPSVVLDIEEEGMYNAGSYAEPQSYIYMLYAICKVSEYTNLQDARRAVSELIKGTIKTFECNVVENIKYTELVINSYDCSLASVKIEVSI